MNRFVKKLIILSGATEYDVSESPGGFESIVHVKGIPKDRAALLQELISEIIHSPFCVTVLRQDEVSRD